MLKLTPQLATNIYLTLKHGPVFRRMPLPNGFDVRFKISRAKDRCGYYQYLGGVAIQHEIGLDQPYCATLEHACETMAHEMIHLYQQVKRSYSRNTDHNAEFKRIAKRVCDAYGFPLSRFV